MSKLRSSPASPNYNDVPLIGDNLQLFKHHWDTHIMHMYERPTDDFMYMLMLLQLDANLNRDHDFYMDYALWKKLPQSERTYTTISTLIDTFLAEKLQQKNRRAVLADALPGIDAKNVQSKAKKGKDKKGKGKGVDESQGQCFSWLNHGECANQHNGCRWKHDPAFKGAWKDGSAKQPKGKKGKGKDGKDKSGKGKSRQPSPDRRNVVTDMSKVCQLYLKNKCTAGAACKLHHNEPCKHHATGDCKKGAACPFPHWNVKTAANKAKQQSTPPGLAGAPQGASAADGTV